MNSTAQHTHYYEKENLERHDVLSSINW